MARSIMVGEVRTGRRITQVPVADAPWSIPYRGVGEISIDIPLGAAEFRVLERVIEAGLYPGAHVWPGPTTYPEAEVPAWRPGAGLRPEFLSAVEPARCFLAVLEGDVVLEAGPIWAHSYDVVTGTLKVKAAGLGSIFDHRIVMGVISSAYATWSTTWSSMSLGTIAKRLIELAMSHAGGNLPIVLPPDEAATDDDDHRRTYLGSEMATVADRLAQLQQVDGGPDVVFEPRLTADRLGVEWVMRVGTSANPLIYQGGADHVWDSRLPRGGVSGLSVARDATGQAGRAWVTGGGMDEALLIARADDTTMTTAGFPLLEITDARSTVTVQSTLNAVAAGNRAAGARPWMTWSVTVRADSSPLLGTYRPGDFAKVWVPEDHPYLALLLPGGFARVRIMSIAGGLGDDVALTFAPVMESR